MIGSIGSSVVDVVVVFEVVVCGSRCSCRSDCCRIYIYFNNLLVWQGSQRVHCEYSDVEEASSFNSSARPESVKLQSVSSFQRLDSYSLHNDWKAVRKSSRRLFLISVLFMSYLQIL